MASFEEFAMVMAGLAAGTGKDPGERQVEVYFRCLSDLPVDALEFAAVRALCESDYPTLPTIGTLRRLAAEFQHGPARSSGEALELARRAFRVHGYYAEREGLASLPDDVAAIVRNLGWQTCCDSTNHESLRARFIELYEQRQASGRRLERLPEVMRARLSAPLAASMARIGLMD